MTFSSQSFNRLEDVIFLAVFLEIFIVMTCLDSTSPVADHTTLHEADGLSKYLKAKQQHSVEYKTVKTHMARGGAGKLVEGKCSDLTQYSYSVI